MNVVPGIVLVSCMNWMRLILEVSRCVRRFRSVGDDHKRCTDGKGVRFCFLGRRFDLG